jgi:hypothetical protein
MKYEFDRGRRLSVGQRLKDTASFAWANVDLQRDEFSALGGVNFFMLILFRS